MITFDQSTDDALAYIVENDLIQFALLERLKQIQFEPRLNSRVQRFELENNAIRLELQNQSVPIRTRLLVEQWFRIICISLLIFIWF